MQDKTPRNEKGEPHGHWEKYNNGRLWYKCNYINGVWYGYFEHHNDEPYGRFPRISKEYAAR